MNIPDPLLDDLGYRYTLSTLLLVLALLRAQSHKAANAEDVPAWTTQEGKAIGLLRLALNGVAIGIVLVYLVWPPLAQWAMFDLPPEARGLGAFLAAAAMPFFWWVNASLGANFSATLHLKNKHTLVTHGPYRYMRHPMYIILFVILIGFGLLAANWVTLACTFALTLLICATRTPKEEKMLADAFGQDYAAWAEKTGRFLPKIF